MSLSARRAWIEIRPRLAGRQAPRASLSARRAWIEITESSAEIAFAIVALRKESVDRNLASSLQKRGRSRRSPQGERG